jgi:FdhD protein
MGCGEKTGDGVISAEPIVRFDPGGGFEAALDECVREHRLMVQLDGVPIVRVVLSPCSLEEFVVGFLLNEGFIAGPEDIRSMEISGGTAFVYRSRPEPIAGGETAVLESTGATRLEPRPDTSKPMPDLPPEPLVTSQVILRCMKSLDKMPIHRRTGGTHCAVLFTAEGEMIFGCEDIGRHNAVDKTVGGALRAGADLRHAWLAVAGRLAADMVRKPAVSGIPLVASLAAATFDGIELGRHRGLTVIGHCKKGSFNCYCHPERIKDYDPPAKEPSSTRL